MRPRVASAFIVFALTAATTSAAQDDQYAKFDDPFRVYLGGFWPKLNSELNINSDSLPPIPPIDVENVLGVEESKFTGWGGIAWQISRRNSIELEGFSLKRDGARSGTFTPPIRVGNTFIENGSLNTSYDTSVLRLTYGFSILRNELSDLKLKVGLHNAKISAAVQLGGAICNPTTTPSVPPGCPNAGVGIESQEVTAPLPHFGGSYVYAITPSIGLRLQAIGFAIKINDIEGSIIELDADVSWQPWRNFGVGAGLRYFKAKVDGGTSELNGGFQLDYVGPAIYMQATF